MVKIGVKIGVPEKGVDTTPKSTKSTAHTVKLSWVLGFVGGYQKCIYIYTYTYIYIYLFIHTGTCNSETSLLPHHLWGPGIRLLASSRPTLRAKPYFERLGRGA